jgi:hypothetical protein
MPQNRKDTPLHRDVPGEPALAGPPCDVSGVSSLAVAVEYTLVVILCIFRVGRDDKRTGYAADSLAVARVSGGLEFCGGGGIHSSGCISHPPG